jgi:hypothetical protein
MWIPIRILCSGFLYTYKSLEGIESKIIC